MTDPPSRPKGERDVYDAKWALESALCAFRDGEIGAAELVSDLTEYVLARLEEPDVPEGEEETAAIERVVKAARELSEAWVTATGPEDPRARIVEVGASVTGGTFMRALHDLAESIQAIDFPAIPEPEEEEEEVCEACGKPIPMGTLFVGTGTGVAHYDYFTPTATLGGEDADAVSTAADILHAIRHGVVATNTEPLETRLRRLAERLTAPVQPSSEPEPVDMRTVIALADRIRRRAIHMGRYSVDTDPWMETQTDAIAIAEALEAHAVSPKPADGPLEPDPATILHVGAVFRPLDARIRRLEARAHPSPSEPPKGFVESVQDGFRQAQPEDGPSEPRGETDEVVKLRADVVELEGLARNAEENADGIAGIDDGLAYWLRSLSDTLRRHASDAFVRLARARPETDNGADGGDVVEALAKEWEFRAVAMVDDPRPGIHAPPPMTQGRIDTYRICAKDLRERLARPESREGADG